MKGRARQSAFSPTVAASTDVQDSYSKSDILCGRGGLANNHFGNRAYRRIIEDKKELYRKLSHKRDKLVLVRSIVLAVKTTGARFLKYNKKTKGWQEINEKVAIEKTSQAFREPSRPRPSFVLKDDQSCSSDSCCNKKGAEDPAIHSISRRISLLEPEKSLATSSSSRYDSLVIATKQASDGAAKGDSADNPVIPSMARRVSLKEDQSRVITNVADFTNHASDESAVLTAPDKVVKSSSSPPTKVLASPKNVGEDMGLEPLALPMQQSDPDICVVHFDDLQMVAPPVTVLHRDSSLGTFAVWEESNSSEVAPLPLAQAALAEQQQLQQQSRVYLEAPLRKDNNDNNNNIASLQRFLQDDGLGQGSLSRPMALPPPSLLRDHSLDCSSLLRGHNGQTLGDDYARDDLQLGHEDDALDSGGIIKGTLSMMPPPLLRMTSSTFLDEL